MPKVRGKLPDVRCLVVGDVPPALKVKHASEFFMFLGQVDDLGSVLSASHLALSPIFTGSGIKVKVLDYAAAGLPILCSSESLEGIASESSDVSAFAAEDDPARYAQRITELLGAPAELDRLATAARSVVSRQLWPTIAQRTAGFYRDAAVRPPKGILTSPEATAVDVPQPYFLDDYFDQSRFGQSAETARKYLRRGGYGKLEAWPDKGTAG
jgi:glycosyltransferase involved in cell wall biosynthesis